ncbi:MAG: hypothetical protein NT154_44495 [Verrucomicrobia bacterium]|nr:hypothetical protein [Verrucomicrobiota bacterium]
MRNLAFIVVVIAVIVVLVLVLLPRPHRTTGSPPYSVMMNNLRQLDGAKHQWLLEKMPASNVWPSKAEITDYLGRGGVTSFKTVMPPVDGEIYVINRADRPVAVYMTKDAFGYKEGQLLCAAFDP